MAHHKRKRRKDRRSGCLMCKAHKSCALKDTKGARTRQEVRADDREESFEEDRDKEE